MQTHGGVSAATVIESNSREFQVRVLVDWDRDGKFESILSNLSDLDLASVVVDRALKGAAPEELLLIEGYSAAELDLTVGGDYNGMPLPALFSPYNRQSPFYGKHLLGCEIKYEIIVDTPIGQVTYPQFIGEVRTIEPDRSDNSVRITALDRVERLRKPVQLPPFAMSSEHVNYGEINSQLIRSHWVIDHCLRMCDVGVAPKRPTFRYEQNVPDDGLDGVLLYVTGNGSYLPSVGYLDNPNADTFPDPSTPMYADTGALHPDAPEGALRPQAFNGLGLPVQQRYGTPGDKGIIRYWAADQDKINPKGNHFLGFTLNTNGVDGNDFQSIGEFPVLEVYIGNGHMLTVVISQGQVWSERWNWIGVTSGVPSNITRTQKVDIPTGQDTVDIFVMWDNTPETGSRAQVRAGANTTGLVPVGDDVPDGTSVGADQIKGRVTIGQALSISDVYYSVRNFYGAEGDNFSEAYRVPKYTGSLDRGLNRFSFTPTSKAVEAWDMITEVAAAEFGAVFWDEEGYFRFWNFDTITAKQANIVRYITLDHTENLGMVSSLDSVRNSYTVQATRRRATFTGASYNTFTDSLYSSSDPNEFYVPGRTVRTFTIWQDDVLSPLTFYMQKYMSTAGTTFPVWSDTIGHGYCVQYLMGGTWQERGDRQGVDIRVYFTAKGYLQVTVWNGWDEPIRLAKGTGEQSQAAFRFAGTKISDDEELSIPVKDQASINIFGERNLTLKGDWYQEGFATTLMVPKMLARTKQPIPATDNITIAGDPRLQLGDTIGAHDPDGFGPAMALQILGIRRSWDEDGLTDELTVEMVSPFNRDDPVPIPGYEDEDVTGNPGTNPGGGGSAGNPGQLLWIGPADGMNHFGVSVEGVMMTQAEIYTGFEQDDAFELKDDNKAVIFRAEMDGPVTGGSVYPRTELREYEQNGTAFAAWNATSGLHWMEGTTAITHLQPTQKNICFAHVMNIGGSLVRLHVEDVAGVLKLTSYVNEDFQTEWDSYTIGQEIKWRIEVENGTLRIFLSGEVARTEALVATNCWFNAGCWPQSNDAIDSPTEYASVEMKDFRHWHTGWPSPTTPGYIPDPGGGSGGGGGGPGLPPVGGGETAAGRFGWGTPHPISDTFDYTGAPDPSKWGNSPDEGMPGHNGNGRRVAYCTTVYDGKMVLHGYPNGDTGWIRQNIDVQYGRWETRVRSQNLGGGGEPYHVLNLIWPTSENWPGDGEYDWFEIEDPDADFMQAYLHYPHPNMPVEQEWTRFNGANANDWHNIAFEWGPGGLKGWVDGQDWYAFSGGGGPAGRSNIQNMPRGHLVHQLDNFGSSREAIFEIDWSLFYPLNP